MRAIKACVPRALPTGARLVCADNTGAYSFSKNSASGAPTLND